MNFDVTSQCSWKEDDQKWFLKNPHRTYRLRRIASGELPIHLVKNSTHVVIKRIASNLREKRFLTDMHNGQKLDEAPEVEALVFALWQEIANAEEGQIIPFDEMWLTALASEEWAS